MTTMLWPALEFLGISFRPMGKWGGQTWVRVTCNERQWCSRSTDAARSESLRTYR